jgi:signal transduction histidine kinase
VSQVISALHVLTYLALFGAAIFAWVWLRRGTRPGKTVPVRVWLGVGLAAIFLTTVAVVEGAVQLAGGHSGEITDAKAFETVQPFVTGNVARWSDPAWQADLQQRGAKVGVDLDLVDARGNTVFRSSPDPLASAAGGGSRSITRSVRTVTVPDPSGGSDVVRMYSYPIKTKNVQGVRQVISDLLPIIGLGTLALAIGAAAASIGPAILRPLAAMSRAARRIASGSLDVELPSSRVREVAEVSAAFSAMGDALRDSLERQAELEQERRLFITAVAHDLRTPLFSLRGYLEGLEEGVANTPEKRAQYIRVAKEKADALERLIADLFAYTRLEYLEEAPRRERLDFGALATRIAEGMQPQAEAKGGTLTLDAAGEAAAVEADGHLLGRALENLLDNAVRFTPAGGEVRLRWRTLGERLVFSVSDTGPGIPPQDLPRLFDPLFRSETSRNRQTGGAGLGLTIARRVLQAHGGDLTAANGATGGAVFTAVLPAVADRDGPSAPSEADRTPRDSSPKLAPVISEQS